ncbi:MAG: hypothetical protein O3B65_00775 [Chloroflexi bacterium]|nr:hypothetical protein [Chloroflexota bacterium]
MTSAFGNAERITIVDRTFASDGQTLYQRLGALLAQRGFNVQQTEPPEAGANADTFRGGLRAERDIVLDATKRRVGKWMVIVGAVMTGLTLALMVSGVDSRWLLEWLLTIEVIGGGYGLKLIKDPPDWRRTTLDVSLVGEPGGAHVLAREGTGKVEDDVVFEWIEGSSLLITEADVEALA